jgi:hypothetical protein
LAHLVSLLAARHRAGEGFLLSSVHTHGAEDRLGADGTLCGPGLTTVRLLIVHLLFIILTAWRGETHTHTTPITIRFVIKRAYCRS